MKSKLLYIPPASKLCTDNVGVVGIAAHFKSQRKEFVKDFESAERIPRLSI